MVFHMQLHATYEIVLPTSNRTKQINDKFPKCRFGYTKQRKTIFKTTTTTTIIKIRPHARTEK